MAPRRRRRDSSASSDTSVDEQVSKHQGIIQSLELMKIALHTCLATLFFIRELLPQDVFTWRYVPGAQPGKIYSYNDFLGGKKSVNGRKKSPPLRIIERGLDDAADRILDLLEEGIFDALVRRNLAAVQFTVTPNKARPDTAVESYTITLDHAGRLGNALLLEEEQDRGKWEEFRDSGLIVTAQKHIQNMNRKLSMLAGGPALPSTRTLGVQLYYSDDCPTKYQAHGFKDVTPDTDDEVLLFPIDDDWARTTGLCGLINGGYHTAAIRVSWLRCRCNAPWLVVLLPGEHSPGCHCLFEDEQCLNMAEIEVPMQLTPPLDFGEVVLRDSQIGLPSTDMINGEDSSLLQRVVRSE